MKKKNKNSCNFQFLLASLVFFLTSFLTAQNQELDILISGANVFIDKEAGFEKLEVGIKGDKIVYLEKPQSRKPKASQYINAEGLILSPGFIDPHTHLSFDLSRDDRRENLAYLHQGVTTIFTGNDGSGPLPVGAKLDEWQRDGIGTNAALFVGHNSVREEVLGLKDVQPTVLELEKMKDLVEQAMEDGAFGISTGLFYSPGSYAGSEEVIELSKIASKHGGIYDTHMRDESSYTVGLIKSVEEVLEIGEKANIPVHISHIKALGKDVWGKSSEVIKKIEDAREKGIRVTANQYPYPASRTNLISAVIPRWAENGGYEELVERFENDLIIDSLEAGITENIRRRGGPSTLIFSSAKVESLNGLSLDEIAGKWKLTPTKAVIKALKADKNIRVVSYNMKDEDLHGFMKQDWVMTGSDGTPGHPRKYGSFSGKMRKYYREDKIIDLPFLLHNQSVLVAEVFGLKKRGRIKEGYYADVIIFNPEEVQDHATFDEPSKLATGMKYVIVNGKIAIEDETFTGELAGKALRK